MPVALPVAMMVAGAVMSNQAGKTAKKGGDAAAGKAETGYGRAEAALSPYNQFGQQYGLGGMASLMGGGTTLLGMAQQSQPSSSTGMDDEMRKQFQLNKALQRWKAEGQWDPSLGTEPVVGVNVAESTLMSMYPDLFTSPAPTQQAPAQQGSGGPAGVWAGGSPGFNEVTSSTIPQDSGNTMTALQALEQTPGYQFTRDQGLEAVNRSAAASGYRGSGNVLQELTKYASGLAQQTYADEFTRRYNIASLGVNAASNLAGAATQTGGQAANALLEGSMGKASAQGQMGSSLMSMGGQMFASSDIRIKENLKYIREHIPGINVYEFNYINSAKKFIGVIAQEVEKVMPEAVKEINGIKHVNYGML